MAWDPLRDMFQEKGWTQNEDQQKDWYASHDENKPYADAEGDYSQAAIDSGQAVGKKVAEGVSALSGASGEAAAGAAQTAIKAARPGVHSYTENMSNFMNQERGVGNNYNKDEALQKAKGMQAANRVEIDKMKAN